jgi:prevent-host-death family protein
MLEIGAFEAKNKLSHLLDLAEKGEEIIITRHGKQVARLLPIDKPFDREAALQAVKEITEMSQGVKLDGITIRELIDEGRP